jgi:hypothetical protein
MPSPIKAHARSKRFAPMPEIGEAQALMERLA